ncbi:MAG: hypothetical protein KBD56_09700 [Candidatus Eisenbacteria bacterium]|nr:hypothetical protein [Candidatus Eisenbacteria bacterium]
MRITRIVFAIAAALSLALPAAAQYVPVLQSADTIRPGGFKLMAAPVAVFGKDNADDEFGVALRGGFGLAERFDGEVKLGIFENYTALGGDVEFGLLETDGLDFSLGGGLHYLFGKDDWYDVLGFEITPLFSGPVMDRLELFAGLNVAFESIQDAPAGFDDTFTRVHLVPGIEYSLSEAFDLVGEVGIGMNDDSFTYVGAGVAYYFR